MYDSHAIAAISAAFLASVVEVTEAYTIVLAVGLSRGWRSALAGTAAALALLVLLVIAFGPLLSRVPLNALQLPIGLLLLLFGMGWLRKAILRAAGLIPLHDEALIFEKELAALKDGRSQTSLDTGGMLTAFQGVLLEGLEVVFIVIAVGVGRHLLVAASAGAALACVLVLCAGALIHRPLSQVPENTLKFAVGIMLASFGVFWIGEALGVSWPGADFALAYIAGTFLLAGISSAAFLKRGSP
jgi:Ca2+/H+ antiporter, TMEM165/GDT1 family